MLRSFLMALAIVAPTFAFAEEARWQDLENDPSCRVWNPAPKPKEALSWTGPCRDGLADGEGRLTSLYRENEAWRERTFDGALSAGKPVPGGYQWVAAAAAAADPAPTEPRHYSWENGNRYEGDMVNGLPHGRGTFSWGPSSPYAGDSYEGDFVEGRRTGDGVYVFANGERYEGTFLEDQFHGLGVFTFANGDRYEGDFRNGAITGTGVYDFAGGDRYEGEVVNGQLHGKGTLHFADGGRCTADWENGRIVGAGEGLTPSGQATECFDDRRVLR